MQHGKVGCIRTDCGLVSKLGFLVVDRNSGAHHLPRPLQSLGHPMRWQASPVKPDRHEQRPVARSHTPMLEHSVNAACAVLLPVARSTHAFPLGQSPEVSVKHTLINNVSYEY